MSFGEFPERVQIDTIAGPSLQPIPFVYKPQIDSFFIICVWHVAPGVCQQGEAREHVHFVQQFIVWPERRACAWPALNERGQALTE